MILEGSGNAVRVKTGKRQENVMKPGVAERRCENGT
jgi:hypothetical protein